MNRHISTEQLSAYHDSELGIAERRQLESHCSRCEACTGRLESMRRMVHGLGRVERAAPPAALRQQIRREAAEQVPAYGLRKAFDAVRLLLFPLQPGLRTATVMGLALVVSLFTLHQNDGGFLRPVVDRPEQEIVTVETGAQLGQLLTTSEVAGREFIWTDNGWIQRGLEGQTPVTSVDSGSPQGRALLTRYSDLEFLLRDGSPVVLRYNLETVEIRNAPPSRVLGYEARPARPVTHAHHGRTVAA
ncbi:MAG TPA: zf-HC2 domain-containing protein [Thermoanaerobaculia bacterium]